MDNLAFQDFGDPDFRRDDGLGGMEIPAFAGMTKVGRSRHFARMAKIGRSWHSAGTTS
ncbi:protein of unknown function [Micropruina glycogenica]|uniref:Uncharacterized protein n=1 Tax=Micropruina glycogenica TaxID=75385 RepID=A0A2N9JEM9_9ACTN|nr:protein of unknown function [Micropruina glycogenica]